MTKNIFSNIWWKEKRVQHAGHQALTLFPSKHASLVYLSLVPLCSLNPKPTTTLSYQLSGAGRTLRDVHQKEQSSFPLCHPTARENSGLLQVWMTSTLPCPRMCTHTSSLCSLTGLLFYPILPKAIITWLLTLTYSLIFVHIS